MLPRGLTIQQYIARSKARKEKRAEKRAALGLPEKARTSRAISIRKRLVTIADTVFSLRIRLRDKRARGYCPFHGSARVFPIECCFHMVTRAKYSVRWETRNAVGACHGCNHENEFNPHRFIAWYIGEYGKEAFEKLVRDSNMRAGFTNDDLRRIIDENRKAMATGKL